MSKVDDELTRRLRGAERPLEGDGLFDALERRRARRETLRKTQVGFLALAVVAATAVGFVALRRAFDGSGRSTGETPAPVLAANGEIVFSAEGEDGYAHLYAVQPDGSGRRQITDFGTDDSNPAVSPDGRTIAFIHELEDLTPVVATIPIEGGTVTWLMDPALSVTDGPAWSPDGRRIAFAAGDGGLQRIYVMGSDGSDPQPITGEATPWAEDPAWSPDGTGIAFSASPDAGSEGPTTFDIFTIGPDGDGLVNVTETPEVGSDEFGPSWSPDSTRLVYARNSGDGMSLVVRQLSDGRETAITDGTWVDVAPTWSPDGRAIVFERAPLPGDRSDVWWTRTDGSDAVQLTFDGGADPTWQPLPDGVIAPSPSPTLEPSPSPSPEPDVVEIGLPFRLCHAARLDGVNFLGDGARGIAWVGIRTRDTGACPPQGAETRAIVAADVHGDGIADSWWGGIEYCLYCEPRDASDLDGDGDEELIVLESLNSTPSFLVLTILRGGSAEPELAPVVVAAPGHEPAGYMSGQPLRISSGGDEGFAGWVRCERFPDAPVLVLTWRDHPIEGDTMEVHETRFVLDDDVATVVGASDTTAPVGSDIAGVSDDPACGVDWQLLS